MDVREMGMGARMMVLAPVDGDPRNQEIALRPLIVMMVDRRSKIKEVLYIKKKRQYVIHTKTRLSLTRGVERKERYERIEVLKDCKP
jgi:hypothetical protein